MGKTLWVNEETHSTLKENKRDGQSFDDLLLEMLDQYDPEEAAASAVAGNVSVDQLPKIAAEALGDDVGEADTLAASVLAPTELAEAGKKGRTPAEYLEAEFSIDASSYNTEKNLSLDLTQARREENQ